MESIRALIRAVSTHEKEILRSSDENIFSLLFLQSQIELSGVPLSSPSNEGGESVGQIREDAVEEVHDRNDGVQEREVVDESRKRSPSDESMSAGDGHIAADHGRQKKNKSKKRKQ
jgi:hypothetical protein